MSHAAMTWAVKQKCGSPAAKLVLMMLADHANGHTGRCNPSQKLLADEAEMSVSALKVHIKKLADKGLITVVPVFVDGVRLPNQYDLNLTGGGAEQGGSVRIWLGVRQNLAGGSVRIWLPLTRKLNPELNHKIHCRSQATLTMLPPMRIKSSGHCPAYGVLTTK